MKALEFTGSLASYAATLALGRLVRSAYWGPLSCLRLREGPEPVRPGPDWAVVRTRLAGICGSDLHLILLQTSPTISAFTSFPFIVGHENVGELADVGEGVGAGALAGKAPPAALRPGQRVVVDPLLPCAVRSVTPPCPQCGTGDYSRCESFVGGGLSAGLLLGGCRDTGGTWSPLFLAHKSQIFPVPDGLQDEAAVLVEPLAVALHAAARSLDGRRAVAAGRTEAAGRAAGGSILVVGGGIIGLCLLASLRHLGVGSRVVALVRHAYQAGLASAFGADEVVTGHSGWDVELARSLGADLRRPLVGRPVPTTGAQAVFECAGSPSALDTALRFAAPGAEVVLVGLAGAPRGIDWSYVWRKELHVRGTFCYGWEDVQDRGPRRTFELALELLASGEFGFSDLVTHRFRLEDYRRAFRVLLDKRSSRAVKAVFTFDRTG